MKILIISDAWHPQINGVVRTYEHISEELTKKGCDVKIIGPADFHARMAMPGYHEIELAVFPYPKLSRMIENFAPDHIHIAVEGPLGWAARNYCKKHKLSFTTSYHTKFPQYFAERAAKILPLLKDPAEHMGQLYVKRFHKRSKRMMVASETLRDDLAEMGISNDVHHLTRGVDLSLFYPKGDNTATPDMYENLERPIALYVGRVSVEKNLEAFLTMEWPGTKVVIGDGPSRKMLMKKYPETRFLGPQTGTTLADYYRSSDVFVFPSKTDTFGIVIIEALACGVPVATYDVTGPRDILKAPELGVMGDDLGQAAQAAMNLGSPQARYDFVKDNFTWDKAAQQFLEAFTEHEEENRT